VGVPGALRGLPLIDDLGDLSGRRVLVRVDFNVPLEEGPDCAPVVADDFRIRSAIPTLELLRSRGAEIVCCSHLGRPKGKPDPRYAMGPVRERLEELFPDASLLENLRFDPGEETNDPAFVDRLVEGFDAYVNDAFGASHRSHASVVGPPERLPSAAGPLLAHEVEVLGGLLGSPARPFVAILGGAKVADKIGVVASIARSADTVIIGGGMAYTFLAAQGRRIGTSLFDGSRVEECAALLEANAHIVVTQDVVALEPGHPIGPGRTEGEVRVFDGDLPEDWEGLDIGPETRQRFAGLIADAATVLWNGPMGFFEDERFSKGTEAVARAITSSDAFSVVGGGDSALALERLGLAGAVSFMSTGGGASLELLEFGDLPALAALRAAVNAPRGA
jgi:phosphoglycerate kinase